LAVAHCNGASIIAATYSADGTQTDSTTTAFPLNQSFVFSMDCAADGETVYIAGWAEDSTTPWFVYTPGNLTAFGSVFLLPQVDQICCTQDGNLMTGALTMAKMKPDGTLIWTSTVEALARAVDKSGNLYGIGAASTGGSAFAGLFKLDSDGNRKWGATLPGTQGGYDACCSANGKSVFSWGFQQRLDPAIPGAYYYSWNPNTGAGVGGTSSLNTSIPGPGNTPNPAAGFRNTSMASADGRAAFFA
jgi:hypothetical protein